MPALATTSPQIKQEQPDASDMPAAPLVRHQAYTSPNHDNSLYTECPLQFTTPPTHGVSLDQPPLNSLKRKRDDPHDASEPRIKLEDDDDDSLYLWSLTPEHSDCFTSCHIEAEHNNIVTTCQPATAEDTTDASPESEDSRFPDLASTSASPFTVRPKRLKLIVGERSRRAETAYLLFQHQPCLSLGVSRIQERATCSRGLRDSWLGRAKNRDGVSGGIELGQRAGRIYLVLNLEEGTVRGKIVRE